MELVVFIPTNGYNAVSFFYYNEISNVYKTLEGEYMQITKSSVALASVLLLTAMYSVPICKADEPDGTIKKPRLILQITVDQLRGDLPGKFVKTWVQVVFAI